jgi:hypothetical protein
MQSPMWLWDTVTGGWLKALGDAAGRIQAALYGINPEGDPVAVACDAAGKVKVSGSFAEAGVAAVVHCSDPAAGAYLAIQPDEGVTWKIINIFWEYDVVISWYDGTHEISLPAEVGAGCWLNLELYVTNGNYLRVKNSHSSAAKKIGYSGVIVT